MGPLLFREINLIEISNICLTLEPRRSISSTKGITPEIITFIIISILTPNPYICSKISSKIKSKSKGNQRARKMNRKRNRTRKRTKNKNKSRARSRASAGARRRARHARTGTGRGVISNTKCCYLYLPRIKSPPELSIKIQTH